FHWRPQRNTSTSVRATASPRTRLPLTKQSLPGIINPNLGLIPAVIPTSPGHGRNSIGRPFGNMPNPKTFVFGRGCIKELFADEWNRHLQLLKSLDGVE